MKCISYISVAVVKYHDQKPIIDGIKFQLMVLDGESMMVGESGQEIV